MQTATSSDTTLYFNQIHHALLFKIDESYKIVTNFNQHIITLHNKIYENITSSVIIFHPGILTLFPNFLDEYNFFEDETNDIDIICNNINFLSNSIINTENLLNINSKICNTKQPNNYQNYLSKQENIVTGFNNNFGYELNKHYYILFNKYFLTTHFINTDIININDLKTFFPEFNLLNIVFLSDDTLTEYKNIFKNITDEQLITTRLNILLNNHSDKIIEGKPTFETIKLYLETKYKITNNIEERIQFSTIYYKILNDIKLTNEDDKNTIHKLLPVVLKDLGLEKKRYSTGIFWYGLVLKNSYNNSIFNNDFIKITDTHPKLNNDELNNKMEELIKIREEENKNYQNMFPKPSLTTCE